MAIRFELVSGAAAAAAAAPVTSIIEALPQELFSRVTSFFHPKDLESLTLLNRNLRLRFQEAATEYSYCEAKEFIKALAENVNEELYKEQKELLATLSHSLTLDTPFSLQNLKSQMMQLEKELIKILQTIDKESGDALMANVKLPPFFEKLPNFLEIERKIEDANTLIFRDFEFSRLCESLLAICRLDRAIEIARLISSEEPKEHAFSLIAKRLLAIGQLDKAVEMAMMIRSGPSRDSILSDSSKALVERGQLDRAVVIAQRISSVITREAILSFISFKLDRISRINRLIADFSAAIKKTF